MIQKTNKNIPRRNKYILENILLNIFKFYILKYTIKFLQSRGNNNKKKLGFHNFAEHLQKARGTLVKNQCVRVSLEGTIKIVGKAFGSSRRWFPIYSIVRRDLGVLPGVCRKRAVAKRTIEWDGQSAVKSKFDSGSDWSRNFAGVRFYGRFGGGCGWTVGSFANRNRPTKVIRQQKLRSPRAPIRRGIFGGIRSFDWTIDGGEKVETLFRFFHRLKSLHCYGECRTSELYFSLSSPLMR